VNSKSEIKRRPRRRQRAARSIGVATIDRVADRIELAIDLLTLGQYGLECREATKPQQGGTAGCGGSSRRDARGWPGLPAAWEVPRTPRRPSCEREDWPWPSGRTGGTLA
jgi:hypothetical protein